MPLFYPMPARLLVLGTRYDDAAPARAPLWPRRGGWARRLGPRSRGEGFRGGCAGAVAAKCKSWTSRGAKCKSGTDNRGKRCVDVHFDGGPKRGHKGRGQSTAPRTADRSPRFGERCGWPVSSPAMNASRHIRPAQRPAHSAGSAPGAKSGV